MGKKGGGGGLGVIQALFCEAFYLRTYLKYSEDICNSTNCKRVSGVGSVK